jgi:uncharacterized protein YydD (DUF2326 family)
VVPAYEELKKQADELDRRVRTLPDEDVIDRRNLADLRRAVAETNDPETGYLERMYEELGVALPDDVRRSFDDVRGFHHSIVRNRRRYLAEEIADIERRVAEREQERTRLGEELSAVLSALQDGGALDGLTARQQLLAQKQATLAALRKQHETALALEISQREITEQRARLRTTLEGDLEERGSWERRARNSALSPLPSEARSLPPRTYHSPRSGVNSTHSGWSSPSFSPPCTNAWTG